MPLRDFRKLRVVCRWGGGLVKFSRRLSFDDVGGGGQEISVILLFPKKWV